MLFRVYAKDCCDLNMPNGDIYSYIYIHIYSLCWTCVMQVFVLQSQIYLSVKSPNWSNQKKFQPHEYEMKLVL